MRIIDYNVRSPSGGGCGLIIRRVIKNVNFRGRVAAYYGKFFPSPDISIGRLSIERICFAGRGFLIAVEYASRAGHAAFGHARCFYAAWQNLY